MASVIFDENSGVVVPSTREVRDDLATRIQNAMPASANGDPVNVDSASPLGQVIDAVSAEAEAKNAEVAYLANMFNPATANGVFLDALANLYGLERKISEPTVVVCTCTGLKGTVIPYGVLVQDGNGNQLRHTAVLGATIGEDGKVETSFATVEHGEVEIGAETVTTIVTVVPGWDSVTNASAGVLGRDEEPDSELRTRMLQSYAINGNGTVPAIQSNLAEIDGVLDCVVLENYTDQPQTQFSLQLNAHSIGVCIVGGEDDAIAKTIFNYKPGGTGTSGSYDVTYIDTEHYNAKYTYKITRPTIVDFNVKVTFRGATMDDVTQQKVKQAIMSDFFGELNNPRVGLATTVDALRFCRCVQDVTDVPVRQILVGIEGGSLADSVDIPATKSATISADSITLVFGG